jgi:hypothetical protein|tara:strand:- start:17110 stop:17322 length:213 start_codon:yes stop_codon:yes gene_type:complete
MPKRHDLKPVKTQADLYAIMQRVIDRHMTLPADYSDLSINEKLPHLKREIENLSAQTENLRKLMKQVFED